MSPEEQQLLQRAIQLSEENNRMLHAMRRDAAWAKAWGVVKIIIIVAPLVWAYYYLQPYIAKVNQLYDQTQQLQADPAKSVEDFLKGINLPGQEKPRVQTK